MKRDGATEKEREREREINEYVYREKASEREINK